jgi:tripartite-type tricarboxylate transporter receptor subunit TctC
MFTSKTACPNPVLPNRATQTTLCLAMALSAAAITTSSQAQSYPVKPIRIVVAVAAGGAPDLAARTIGVRISKNIGQNWVVENRGGANGNVAGQTVAQAPADGYTLLFAPDSLVVINPYLYKNLPFDPVKGLTPISTIITNQFLLAVHPSVPAKTLPEFIEFARKAKPPIAYASAGAGSQHQLFMELLKLRAGVDMLHVPYKGGAPAVASVVAGDTLAVISGGPSTTPQVRAGQLRLLAGTGARRFAVLPDVPTINETYPGYEGMVWTGLWAPAGTPEPILRRMNEETNRVLADNEVREIFRKSGGSESYINTIPEFTEIVRRDTEKYSKIITTLKISAED